MIQKITLALFMVKDILRIVKIVIKIYVIYVN
jgi:hypothetical protein